MEFLIILSLFRWIKQIFPTLLYLIQIQRLLFSRPP